MQQFAGGGTGATEASGRGRATVWESPKQPEKAVSVEARIVSLGASAKLETAPANQSVWRGAVAELETRRQKETGWLACRTSQMLRASAVCTRRWRHPLW